jgi:hypothetical protein
MDESADYYRVAHDTPFFGFIPFPVKSAAKKRLPWRKKKNISEKRE